MPGADAADYATRLLDTPKGPLLAGIRFKGGDLAQPFVEVAAAFVLDAEGLATARDAIRPTFAVFSPPRMRLWRFAGEIAPADAEPDQLLYAAPIAELRARPLPAGFAEVVVGPSFDTGRHRELVEAYGAIAQADPALGAEIGPASVEELAECLEQGLLFDAHVDWEWAGVVAAREESFFGRDGVLMVEELLTAPYRGRGLGACMQRHLIERLTPAGGAMLHGTIHATNMASRRTAERCGRVAVMASEFVRL